MRIYEKRVEFLGLLVGENGIRVDPIKVKAITDWPKPKSLTELRGFLGLVQFFRKFIKGYSSIAEPLTNLTKKEMGILKWDGNCDNSFNHLRQALVTAPILAAPDWEKEFQVHVDASSFALGATITQLDNEGRSRVIAYASRKLTTSEKNYTANDREMLGLIHALQRFRCYVEGMKFTVFVDNQILSHFFSKKNISRREARWLEILSDYNISELCLRA